MTAYIAKRLLLVPVQLLGVTVVTFLLVRLIPGDPAQVMAGQFYTPEIVAGFEERFGFDKPIWTQYWLYLQNVVTLDLGNSLTTQAPILEELEQRLPATLELITYSLFVGVVGGIALGALTAVRPGGLGDRLSYGYGVLSGSIADFWLGLLLVYLFFFKLGWLPAPEGRLGLSEVPPPTVTGFLTVDGLIAGNLSAFWSAVTHLVLPVATLSLIYMGMIVKMTRSRLREVITSDYILYARASGLGWATVLRYALRNALPAVVTMGGLMYTFLLGGAVLVEQIFAWGGLGQYAVKAVEDLDYLAIQGTILTAAAFNLLVYLAVDVIDRVIDPRLRMRLT